MSGANEANGFVGDEHLRLQLVLRNDLQHRFAATSLGHHIAAAHVEIKHQPGHWGFDGDAGEQHFGLPNFAVEDADLVEIGLDFLAQASLSAALVGLTSCL